MFSDFLITIKTKTFLDTLSGRVSQTRLFLLSLISFFCLHELLLKQNGIQIEPIDINNNSVGELKLIPNIGDKRAQAIVKLRYEKGSLNSR